MTRYFEVDKGRFDSMLIREDSPRSVAVASTVDNDHVRLEPGYKMSDREAVKEFAEQYGLTVPGVNWWD